MAQLDYAKKFFEPNKSIMHLAGLWLYNPNEITMCRRVMQNLWSLVFYAASMVYFILELLAFKETFNDFNKLFSLIGLLLTQTISFYKVGLLLYYQPRLLGLQNTLQNEKYIYRDIKNFQPEKIFRSAEMFNARLLTGMLAVYSMVGISAFISIGFSIEFDIEEERLPANLTCHDYIPYYFLMPWDRTKTNCRWNNIFLGFSLVAFAWITTCHDGLLAALLNCLKTQLIILGGAIKCMRVRVLSEFEEQIIINFLDEELPLFENRLHEELKNLNRHLQVLLKAAKDIEGIFTFMILCQTLVSLFILASCLFVTSNLPITSKDFISQVLYTLCMLNQLSLFCWFGHGITIASEEINQSLYECNWYSCSKRFKSSLVMIMCRMQRPVYLTIGKFSPLTLSAMVKVCKGAVSYYAAFKSLGN